MIQIKQIANIEDTVQSVLTKLATDYSQQLPADKITYDNVFRVGDKVRKIEIEYQGKTNHNGTQKLKMTIDYEKPVSLIVLYAPKITADQQPNPSLVAHLNEKIKWSEILKEFNSDKDGHKVAEFPTPLGFGGRSPVTHYWSEYAGEMVMTRLAENSAISEVIASKLASALTATNETIEEILGFPAKENKRKVDALKAKDTNPKHILLNYLDYTCRRLSTARQMYESLPEVIYTINPVIKEKVDATLKDIKEQKTIIGDLRTLLTNDTFEMGYSEAEDCVLIHPDIVNFDNLLIDKDNDNEISFIDGILPEGRVLEDYFGPRQIYYYIFKEHLKEWSNPTEFEMPSRTRAYNLSTVVPLLTKLEKILYKDYKIGTHNGDAIVDKVMSGYFNAGLLRRNADIDCKEFKKCLEENPNQAKLESYVIPPQANQ